MRTLVDVVMLYRVTPRLQLGGSVDLGAQEMPDRENARWRGLALYARYAVSERRAIAFRAETFHDPRNGISGAAQTIHEATLTFELRPREPLGIKLESRFDRSSAAVFTDGERNQFLLIASAVVTF